MSHAHHGEALYPGSAIIALRDADFDAPENAKFAKHILRRALAEHLGTKPLNSRSLFVRRTQP
jgi:DNA repair protein RecO (recombination protein O)